MNVILGGGIAGIGAYAGDETAHIFERDSVAGGLCSGFKIGDFYFDKAVHLSFTKDSKVRALFDTVEHFEHHPLPYSWYHYCWLRHPAQNNLFPLSAEEKTEAVKEFILRQQYADGNNFEDWNKSRYGKYLWDHFFHPYNTKYWCVPLKNLEINWIGNRIYQPTLEEILYGSYTDKTPNTYYAPDMRYPKSGGYYSFIRPIVEKAESKGHIHYGKQVAKIDLGQKTVFFSDGEKVSYHTLYSSLPLPDFLKMLTDVPQHIRVKAERLEHTGMALVSFGLKKPNMTDKMWFYIYDTDIMAARVHSPSLKSVSNAPKGCTSIQFEIYYNSKDHGPSKDASISNCIYALKKMKIADEDDILFADYRQIDYSNVIFVKGTEDLANEITAWLRSQGVVPIGRFGEWKYLWSDQAYMSGYTAARKIKSNENPANFISLL